ncbi:MAG: rod-binding protein [Planctomycetaceae bacterium]
MFISTNPTLPAEVTDTRSASVTQKELSPADSRKSTKVEKAIKDFEGLFLSMMIKELRQTSSGDGLFPGDASDTYGGMFDMLLGNELAAGKGLGLESVFRSSAAISQFEERIGQSGSVITRDKAIEGYRNEQLRASAVTMP